MANNKNLTPEDTRILARLGIRPHVGVSPGDVNGLKKIVDQHLGRPVEPSYKDRLKGDQLMEQAAREAAGRAQPVNGSPAGTFKNLVINDLRSSAHSPRPQTAASRNALN